MAGWHHRFIDCFDCLNLLNYSATVKEGEGAKFIWISWFLPQSPANPGSSSLQPPIHCLRQPYFESGKVELLSDRAIMSGSCLDPGEIEGLPGRQTL